MRKIILILAVVVIALVLILFLPIPQGTYDDGGTRDYNALTYKIVVWNKIMAEADENGQTVHNTYRNTSVFWYPDNQKSIDELWQIEKANVKLDTSQPQTSTNPSEITQATDNPSVKDVLNLQYRAVLGVELETEEPKENRIHIECSNIPEIQGQKYENTEALRVFFDYISQTFDVELDSSWMVFAHYYDENKTVGMVEFIYKIGEISTNKSIVFNIDNGIADTVYYKHLDYTTNEEDILNRVRLFKDKYEQEQKKLKEDEKLVKETTNFTYYYNTDKLVYSYTIFFSYGEHQLVNNDYGTVCMIDENGNAVD